MENKLKLSQKELKEFIDFCKNKKKGFIIFLHSNKKWEYIKTVKEYIILTNNIPIIYEKTTIVDIKIILNAFNNNKIKEYVDLINK